MHLPTKAHRRPIHPPLSQAHSQAHVDRAAHALDRLLGGGVVGVLGHKRAEGGVLLGAGGGGDGAHLGIVLSLLELGGGGDAALEVEEAHAGLLLGLGGDGCWDLLGGGGGGGGLRVW